MVLILILVLPALAALASLLPLSRRAGSVATVTVAAAGVVLTSQVALQVAGGGPLVAVDGWMACDGLSAIVLWLVSFVGLATALFSCSYMDRLVPANATRKLRTYYAGFNLFMLSMLAVPILAELAMVWIAVALTTLLSAFLVSFDSTPEALEAAWKYVVLTSLGAVIALFGFFLLYWAASAAGSSTFTWQELVEEAPNLSAPVAQAAFVFILVGLGTKVGLVPLHTWLPDAHSQAPSPVCALLSGVETMTALYVLMRVLAVVRHLDPGVGGWVVGFGLLSAGVAALLLLQAKDIKRLFAFSTIEHMGIILVAAGLGAGGASVGAVYEMFAHALAKSSCFLAAGLVVLAAGTREIEGIRGLIRSSRIVGASLLVGGLAISGVPPFAVFIGELQILRAGIATGHIVAMAALTLFIGIAFCAVMVRVGRMVFGVPGGQPASSRVGFGSVAALLVVGVPLLAGGLYLPEPVRELLRAAAQALGGPS